MAKGQPKQAADIELLLQGVESEYIPAFPVNQLEIWEFNPRNNVDPRSQEELTASIAELGIQKALCVLEIDGQKYVFDGGRRLRSAWKLGLETVPIIFYTGLKKSRALLLAATSNVSSQRMTPLDEGAMFVTILEAAAQEGDELNPEAIARGAGRSLDWVLGRIALVQLPEEIRRAIELGTLSRVDADRLIRCPPARRVEMFQSIMAFRDRFLEERGRRPSDTQVEVHMVGQLEQAGDTVLSARAGVATLLPEDVKRQVPAKALGRSTSSSASRGRRTAAVPLAVLFRQARKGVDEVIEALDALEAFPDDQLDPMRIAQLIREGRFDTSVYTCLERANDMTGRLDEFLFRLEKLGHDINGSAKKKQGQAG